MVERRIVADTLRLNYQGILVVDDFYKEVNSWLTQRGYDRFLKSSAERVKKDSRQIEIEMEPWKKINEYTKTVLHLRFLFTEIKDVVITKDRKRKKMNQAKVLIVIQGITETDWENKWESKPVVYFLRMLVDQFLYKIHTDKYYGLAAEDAGALYLMMKSYLNIQRY